MSNLNGRRHAVSGIRDYLDERDRVTKHRSHANEEMWGHDARFPSSGSPPFYNIIEGGLATGWHQQTSSLYNGRRWHRGNYGRRGRDIGGPFFTRRVTLRHEGTYPHYRLESRWGGGGIHYYYDGILFPSLETWGIARSIYLNELNKHAIWTSSSALSVNDLRSHGERLMLSVVPTSSTANALVSVGELVTEGKLFTTPGKALLTQNPGGEFLNYQFGILPVVSDAKSFSEAASTFSETISQYRRDSGKVVRRKAGPYVIQEDTKVETSNSNPITTRKSPLSTYLVKAPKGLTMTTKTKREVWYSGAFEYFIPKDMSRLEELMFEWNRAYGIVPDPADIWELLPFSWLADWQTSSGNALRHLFLQASEGATQRYGYVMCTSTVEKLHEWTGSLRVGNVWQPVTISFSITEVIRQRERVRPFGTTYTGKALTARQLAILGALGIAK